MTNYDDFSGSLVARSDQINALDLGGDTLFRITAARYYPEKGDDQPLDIFVDGFKLPWKPSKGMRRIIAEAWGTKCSTMVGKTILVYCDKEVTFGKDKTGGIRIKAMTDIPKQGIKTITRKGKKPVPYFVEYLEMRRPTYPPEQFEQAFQAMVAAMESGKMTLQQVVAHCQKTGDLTPEQLKRLEENEPKEESPV